LERRELVVVIVLVLISLALGFGIYSVLIHPLTGEFRARFKGGKKRARRWLKTHARRIVLVLVLAAVGIALLSLGFRYGGSIVRGVAALLSGRKNAAEVGPEPLKPAVPDSASGESVTPEAPALEQPALQPAAPTSEPPEP
jgi:hypothetical protein